MIVIALMVSLSLISTVLAAERPDENYIKVEIKGTLRTGIMAIGGETTGTVVRVKNVTWELDFSGNDELRNRAATLNNKTVLLTGTYETRRGVEVRERHIVKVTTLKAAE